MDVDLDELHDVLLDLTGLLNRSQPDTLLLERVGLTLDRALFPILSRVGSREAITIDELAELAGRDQSTVSRQVSKLEELGLVKRGIDAADRRRRAVTVTEEGREVLSRIGLARKEMLRTVFREWSAEEQHDLVSSMGRFVDSVRGFLGEASGASE